MNESVWRFRVGVVVLVAGMIVVILGLLFGASEQFLQPRYFIKIRFPSAPGVAKNTPVRKNGVPIGRVQQVQLIDSDAEEGVILTLAIDADRRLRMNEKCRIGVGSLVTGDAVLEFVRDANSQNRSFIENGAYLPNSGEVAEDPLQQFLDMSSGASTAFEGLQKAFVAVEDAGNKMSSTFTAIEQKLDVLIPADKQQQVDRILSKAEQALESFGGTMDAVRDVVQDQDLRSGLQSAMSALPKAVDELTPLFQDARGVVQQAKGALEKFDTVGLQAQRIASDIEQLTQPLADRGPTLAQGVEDLAVNLNRGVGELVLIGEQINRGEGTIGRLVYEEELYDRVQQTLWNVEDITKGMPPIVRDVRVFTDKIARDPSVLARGALRNNGGGLKSGL